MGKTHVEIVRPFINIISSKMNKGWLRNIEKTEKFKILFEYSSK